MEDRHLCPSVVAGNCSPRPCFFREATVRARHVPHHVAATGCTYLRLSFAFSRYPFWKPVSRAYQADRPLRGESESRTQVTRAASINFLGGVVATQLRGSRDESCREIPEPVQYRPHLAYRSEKQANALSGNFSSLEHIVRPDAHPVRGSCAGDPAR